MAISAVMVGIRLASELRFKEKQAELSCFCVEEIKNDVRYARMESRNLFDEMRKKYPQLGWLKSTGSGEIYSLGREFCQTFGSGDLQSQMELCDMYISRFGHLHKQYSAQREEKERLYISLGAFAGIALFILFI